MRHRGETYPNAQSDARGGQAHFGAAAVPVFGHVTYIAIAALVLNVAVSAMLTVVFRKIGLQDGYDATRRADYTADPLPVTAARIRTPGYSDQAGAGGAVPAGAPRLAESQQRDSAAYRM